MSTTLQDVDSLTQDYCGNYSTGVSDADVRYRAINKSIEYLKRLISFPNDEEIFSFWYTDDQFFYDLPAKFMEALELKYHNPLSNRPNNKWDFFDYPTVLQGVGGSRRNRWSITNINGRKQLVVVGNNGLQGRTIITMDSITDVTVDDDASGLAVNILTPHEGTGAIQFDITNSTGAASIVFSNLNLDLNELFERSGFLKLWAFMTDNEIDSVAIKLQSSVGNYYTITTTTADDGTTFTQDEWQKIGFHTEDAVATGTPVLTAITEVTLTFDLGVGFTTAADFKIDQLFTAFPEQMDLVMYTNIKGTAADGTTEKSKLDTATDILGFSGEYDDYDDLVAQRAAINLWMQLRGDKEAYILLKQDFSDSLKSFARRNPRKRIQGTFRHSLKR